MKTSLLLILSYFLFCSSCKSVDTNTQVTQKQFEYPILKSKEFNNVLQININRADTLQKTFIKEIVINTQGTTQLRDIESVAIYYTGKNKGDLNEKHTLFSETRHITSVIRLKGSIELSGQENYFWLSYKLKDSADILNQIGGYCESVFTSHEKVLVNKLKYPKKLRIGVALRKHGDENVHTYRIPALVVTNEGSLLAAYDARRNSSRDLQGDIDIGVCLSTDGGNSWGSMNIALDKGEWGGLPQKFNGISDASLLMDKRNGIVFVAGLWMYGVINAEGKWIKNLTQESTDWNHQWRNKGSQPGFDAKETSQFLIARSTDDGKTWEKPINLTKMCKKKEWWLWAPAPGNGITMSDGTLVLPTQGRDKNGIPFSNITYSKDGGLTWKTSKPAYSNTTECAVIQLNNGSLMLNMRDNRNRNNKGINNGRAIATTSDLGETWLEHSTSHSALVESVCMASLYKHDSTIFFSNPNTKNGRHHMTIKVSFDNGNTWPEEHWLLLDEGYGRGYSCITSIDENNIGILYESSQADLVFQKIPISEIKCPITKN